MINDFRPLGRLIPAVCALVFFYSSAYGSGLKVEMLPKSPVIGQVAAAVVEAPPGVKPREIRMGALHLPLFPVGKGRWSALIGFPLDGKPGKRLATISYLKNGLTELYPFEVEVRAKEYPAEYIQVPEKMVSFDKATLKKVLDDQRAIRQVCSRRSLRRYWSEPFVMPLDTRVKSPFGLRRFFNGKPRSPHSGVDLKAAMGAPVRAANAGVVALVRRCYLSGNTVVIDHGQGLFTLYAHLSTVEVKEGEVVTRGQIIGRAGKSGRATGPHLHWGVSLLGHRVDPISLVRVTQGLFGGHF